MARRQTETTYLRAVLIWLQGIGPNRNPAFISGVVFEYRALRHGNAVRFTSQTVLAITVGIVCLGETFIHWRKASQRTLTGA